MNKVIDFQKWKRARLGRYQDRPIDRRARPRWPDTHGRDGFVRIGEVSDAILRRLTE